MTQTQLPTPGYSQFNNLIVLIFLEAYLVENSLQPSEQDVPLEEFFWTGSGDGPSYSKPKDSHGNEGKYPNTVVRTATILATVYIDGNYVSQGPALD